MFQTIRDHPQSKSLNMVDGFIPGRRIDHHARKVGDLRDPTAVSFLLRFDGKVHT
jgi:hypothetical protein